MQAVLRAGSYLHGMCMSKILNSFLENRAALRRYLRRFGLRAEDIEDIVQETFIRAFAAEGTQKIRFPKAFLFRIARNLALNERMKLSNTSTDALEDLPDQSVIEDVGQISVDEDMYARRQIQLLAQAVAELPPQCSRVFLLRKVQGLSYKQIAERLDISVSTVEKHVALGLLRCSDYLRQQGYQVNRSGGQPEGGRDDGAPLKKPAKVYKLKNRIRARDE
jgi:RNA polymerase sigma factor (sigma-70 family)